MMALTLAKLRLKNTYDKKSSFDDGLDNVNVIPPRMLPVQEKV